MAKKKRSNTEWPNEVQIYLLKQYQETKKLIDAVEDLDTWLCEHVSSHVKDWIEDLGGWEGTFDLEKDDKITFHKSSWALDDSQTVPVTVEIGIIGEEEDEYWITHLLGITKEPMKVMVRLEKSRNYFSRKDGKKKVVELGSILGEKLKSVGFKTDGKTNNNNYFFFQEFQLDHETIVKACNEQDPDIGFEQLDQILLALKEQIPAIDKFVLGIRNLAAETEDGEG